MNESINFDHARRNAVVRKHWRQPAHVLFGTQPIDQSKLEQSLVSGGSVMLNVDSLAFKPTQNVLE